MYAAYLQILRAVDAANPARSHRHAGRPEVSKGRRRLHPVQDRIRHIVHLTLDLVHRGITRRVGSLSAGESTVEHRKERARNMASGLDDSIFPRHGI